MMNIHVMFELKFHIIFSRKYLHFEKTSLCYLLQMFTLYNTFDNVIDRSYSYSFEKRKLNA